MLVLSVVELVGVVLEVFVVDFELLVVECVWVWIFLVDDV